MPCHRNSPPRPSAAEAVIGSCVEDDAALSLRQLRVKTVKDEAQEEHSSDSQSSEVDLGLDVSTADGMSSSVESGSQGQAEIPMVSYPKGYCTHCGEMAFCHRASNPGCGGYAIGGVTSFENRNRGHGCPAGAALTVPRSYVRDLSVLSKMPGSFQTLVQMLESGFRFYQYTGHMGPVWQCIHSPRSVSVRWLHLHTFCLEGKVDNLPTHHDYCAKMSSYADATGIAASWLR